MSLVTAWVENSAGQGVSALASRGQLANSGPVAALNFELHGCSCFLQVTGHLYLKVLYW